MNYIIHVDNYNFKRIFILSDLIHKKENIFNNINFEDFFPKLSEAVRNGIEKFWEKEVVLNLFALNNYKNIRDEYIVKNSDFFKVLNFLFRFQNII